MEARQLVAVFSARGIRQEPLVLRLARRLLAWAPHERPLAAAALEHLQEIAIDISGR